ncbi:MAG: hypothetical protein JNM00_07335 [Flavobacteriales bacterium]|nr:hypothetical protein [Flavobacteriales bacterium]
MSSQIKLSEFPVETSCEIDKVKQVKKIHATSPCGIVRIEWDDQTFSGGCAGTIVRTYTFTDPCDSVRTAQQYISLIDQLPPILFGLPEVTQLHLADGSEMPPVPAVTAKDNSGELCEVKFTQESTATGYTRIWTCTDQCDNKAYFKQEIYCKGCK